MSDEEMDDVIEEDKPGGVSHPAVEKIFIGSRTFTVKGISSMKFLTMLIDASKFPPVPEHAENRFINATARIKLIETEEGPMLIEMKDEIFFPMGKYEIIEDRAYTYIVYGNMVETFKHLGYQDIFPGNGMFSKLISGLTLTKEEYIARWWDRIKSKWTKTTQEVIQ